MKKQAQQKGKHDPISNYERFTMGRADMTPEQKKEAVEHYKARVAKSGQGQSSRAS